MTRTAAIALSSLAVFASAIAPAALQARTSAPYYAVELAQPATQAETIAGGVLFRCEGTACTAPRSGDRPLRVCSELRRELGTIVSFNAGDSQLSEAQIERCNR